jgi:hypothetical protein
MDTVAEKVEKKFGRITEVGQSEYGSILEVIESAGTDKTLAAAICDEFVAWATAIKKHILTH